MKSSSGKVEIFPLPKVRRHTYHFLQYAEQFRSVYIDTEIDMTAVLRRKNECQLESRRIGYTSYLIHAIARVLRRYPEANVSVNGGWFPKMAQYSDITAKFTIDKIRDGRRIVLSGMIPDADQRSLSEMQMVIDYYKDRQLEDIPELTSIRKLQSLPILLGRIIYRLVMGSLGKRNELTGAFVVTSLGHRPIQSFFPIISNTLCFGVGTIEEKPVVFAGEVRIRPIMKLSLAFDHRAIDGALAADILAEVKQALESDSETFVKQVEEKEVSYVGAST
ncbi:2-oxo acid dehydrogenase subunit E2 [Paenibacillus sp. An7]|uniref:2-oxo acid dehydrogenase subunit E2 n=1 Tax=Paenibacillus sp. An7 TaxID=2689577 RepID=UPI00135B77C5|nr:2-oxo acid dehydrogenase subunit E2 [Paenibacillus sp. An7]